MIVTLDEVQTHLALADAEITDEVIDRIEAIIEVAEDLYQQTCGVKFLAETVIVDEVQDGPGTTTLFVDHPIRALTGIKLGRRRDTTIDVSDPDVLVWKAGSRKITRTDGRRWPEGPNTVWVSYTSQDNVTPLDKMAVKEVVALTYRRIGNEDSKSEKIGDYWHEVVMSVEESLTWNKAVGLRHRPVLG